MFDTASVIFKNEPHSVLELKQHLVPIQVRCRLLLLQLERSLLSLRLFSDSAPELPEMTHR